MQLGLLKRIKYANFFLTFVFGVSVASANNMKIAAGIERVAFVGGASLNSMHGQAELIPGGWAGATFGFNNDFDVINFAGDFRYDLFKTNASGIFVRGSLGFVKGVLGGGAPAADADTSGISSAALLGFEYAMTGNLKLTMAYGFQFLFGYGDTTLGFTNNDAFGNFGVHWYF
jgi:hypothetical protein